jgi:signal transduction histidine kinase
VIDLVKVVQQMIDQTSASATDQGIGIAPEDLPHLFEKHYRARTVGLIAGNGLGLYTCCMNSTSVL